jgi:hypothetical protein
MRTSKGRCLLDGRDVSIISVVSTMSTTIRGPPPGTARATTRIRTRPRRLLLLVKLELGTTRGHWQMTCWTSNRVPEPTLRVVHPRVRVCPREQCRLPVRQRLVRPLGQVLSLPDGNRGLHQRVDPTLWITTRGLPHGLILDVSSSCESSRPVLVTCLFNPRRSANSVLCRLVGRCVSHRPPVSTLSTTIPRLLHGMTRDCRRRSTRTSRSTSETLGESSSTSDLSLRSGPTLDSAISRCRVRTSSRVVTPRS